MTATTIRVQMAQRKDTAANWTAANPILLSGEIGYETDTKKFKIGDGTTNWNSLAYLPIPDGSGNLTITGNLEIGTTGSLTFEGSTANGFETTLAVTDPTADRTITLPNVSGTVVTTGDTGSITSTMIADGTIVNADISSSAEIAVSKLANGIANQVIVTDGTNVSWSDNLTLAGDLTVNGITTTINTQDLLVEDKNIIIGNVATPSDVTADGGGITLKGATDKTISWVDATDAWTSSERFSYPLGSATAPALTFTGDPNTGIYSPGADQVAISTNGTGRLFIDSSGNVSIGRAPIATFGVYANNLGVEIGYSTSLGGAYLQGYNRGASPASIDLLYYLDGSANHRFFTGGNERMRIDSSGRLLVGTSSGQGTSLLQVQGTTSSNTVGADVFLRRGALPSAAGAGLGFIYFGDNSGNLGAVIGASADGSWTSGSNHRSFISFSVTSDGSASPTEACRINSSQQLLVNTNASVASFNPGRIEVVSRASELALVADATDTSAIGIGIRGNTSTTAISFFNASDGATCGTIVLNSGSTSYNTSSDYRLKENVVPLTGAADRVNQFQVHRFNFIADPDKTVDGFLAHEAQAVVPECVTGEKDAVDENGNPVYQGIDQSKLVPLLTAALQEALQKIEDLEGRLTAAGL